MRQRRDGIRQVGLEHWQIEAPVVEADDQVRGLKTSGQLRGEVRFEVGIITILLIAVEPHTGNPEQLGFPP